MHCKTCFIINEKIYYKRYLSLKEIDLKSNTACNNDYYKVIIRNVTFSFVFYNTCYTFISIIFMFHTYSRSYLAKQVCPHTSQMIQFDKI